MPRYIQVPPTFMGAIPGFSQQWQFIEFPDNWSTGQIQRQLENQLGIPLEDVEGFAITDNPSSGVASSALRLGEVLTIANKGVSPKGMFANSKGYPVDISDEYGIPKGTTFSPWKGESAFTVDESTLFTDHPTIYQGSPEQFSPLTENLTVDQMLVNQLTGTSASGGQFGFKPTAPGLNMDDIAGDEESKDTYSKAWKNATDFDNSPGVEISEEKTTTINAYKVPVTSADGETQTITVEAASVADARSAAKNQAETNSDIGTPKFHNKVVTSAPKKTNLLTGNPSHWVVVDELISELPDEKLVYTTADGFEELNPLVDALITAASQQDGKLTELQIAQVTAENSLKIAEFNRDAQIQIATERGETEVEIARINRGLESELARMKRYSDQYIADKQVAAAKYEADQQLAATEYRADTDERIAGLQAGASGAFGFFQQIMGPPPEGGYSDQQMEVLNSLMEAEQQGSIDAAEANRLAAQDNILSMIAGMEREYDEDGNLIPFTPEQMQEFTTLAGLSAEGLMAGAQETAAFQTAGADKYVAEQNAMAAIATAKENANAAIEAAILRGASDEEIAAIQTQSQNLIAVTETEAMTRIAEINAASQKEAQIAIRSLQDSAAIDELTKAQAIAQIQSDAQTEALVAQQTLRETTIVAELDKAKAIATLQQEMQITAQEAMAALQNNQALSELDKAIAIAEIQENTRKSSEIAIAELQANARLNELDKQQIIASLQSTAATTVATTQAGAQTGAAQIQADANKAVAELQQAVGLDENAKALAIANIQATAQQQIAALQTTGATSAAMAQAQATSPYGYLAGGGQLSDVQAVLAGQYNPFGQTSQDVLNLTRAQASGGLTDEGNILGVQQALAANNPYAATQLGQDATRIDQILRGGLTPEQRLSEIQAGQSAQNVANQLAFMSNPSAIGFATERGLLQDINDSPEGSIPGSIFGFNSPNATGAGGGSTTTPFNPNLFTLRNASDEQIGFLQGAAAAQGTTPSEFQQQVESYTPQGV